MMKHKPIILERKTKETDIRLSFEGVGSWEEEISTSVPFFDHMLRAMAFHGGLRLDLQASGDTDVDPHHLVEDCGLVIGDAFRQYVRESGGTARFGSAIIPMDDALAEAVVDAGGRPYLHFDVDFPQSHCGTFDISLCKEFFQALSVRGGLNLHINCRYGENSHHMAEAIFKASGRALGTALTRIGDRRILSTKGSIDV